MKINEHDVPALVSGFFMADSPPGEGASLPWDGGTLTLVSWSQVSDFTAQAVGVCRLVR